MCAHTRRAEPLPAAERRRAIIEAVTPLLIERGQSVTTRQMAEAAGIAEGTIFRVFPDKASLIHEAVRASIDPEPIRHQFAEIDPSATLETQLVEVTRILLRRFETAIALISLLRVLPSHDSHRSAGPPPYVAVANAAINDALAGIFERHRERLRIEPARAAAAMRGLILANGHPAMAIGDRLTDEEVVSVLLNGVAEPSLESVG